MPGLSETIARLSAHRAPQLPLSIAQRGRLEPLAGFGPNPGALAAKSYVPDNLQPGAALVVVLHGCTQNAESYDRGSGWSQIADEQGFALLYPEQMRANNANLCFNWFEPGDTRRGRGEVASIHQMIVAMIAAHGLDRSRVFVTGLSAGGAMTAALLATYPDVFAGGAIIAGLPFGVAATMPEAFAQMRKASGRVSDVRAASGHGGPWPKISVWHGDADHIVDTSNAAAIVAQWRPVHGAGIAPARSERGVGYWRRVWTDAGGREVIECHIVHGMGHGTPVATRDVDGCGEVGPHMLEADVSSTRAITRFWGLETRPVSASVRGQVASDVRRPLLPPAVARASDGPGRVIEDALRAAGLMRCGALPWQLILEIESQAERIVPAYAMHQNQGDTDMADMPTDAIALLKADHRKVEGLFEDFEKASDSAKKAKIADEICTELKIHTMIEEEIFYPALKGKIDEDLLDEAYVEHDGAKVLVNDISTGDPSDDYYDAKVTVLSEEIKHHVREEEMPGEGMFAQARATDVDLVALRDAMMARKEELMAQAKAGGLPPAKNAAVNLIPT